MRTDLIKTLRTRITQSRAEDTPAPVTPIRAPQPQYPRANFARILNGDWDMTGWAQSDPLTRQDMRAQYSQTGRQQGVDSARLQKGQHQPYFTVSKLD